MTMIPDSRSRTFSLTWISPVTQPATAPKRKERGRAAAGWMKPPAMPVAVKAAPRGKVPSTDRSGKSRIRYVMYTPRAMMAYTRPSSKIPKIIVVMMFLQIIMIELYWAISVNSSAAFLVKSSGSVMPRFPATRVLP